VPTLLEDALDDLDPVLEPLLKKEIVRQGSEKVVRVGDTFVAYHPDFKLYITTKSPNPHFKPHIAIHVALVDFTLTLQGLQDQLLGLLVSRERPDLEKEKTELVLTQSRVKQQVASTEDHMLDLLSSCQGRPLDDDVLITALTQSKEIAVKMKAKSKELETTEAAIDQTRLLYKPVAQRAGVLFFVVRALSQLNHMYQFSLAWFVGLFDASIADSKKPAVLEERLANLDRHFCYSLFCQVCQSIFEDHKMLFSFLMAVRLMEFDSKVTHAEWELFLAGTTGIGTTITSLKNPAPDVISAELWAELRNARSLCKNLYAMSTDVAKSTATLDVLREFLACEDPMRVQWPARDEYELSVFQRLLLVRLSRQAQVPLAVQRAIEEFLGRSYVDIPTVSVASVFAASSCRTPIIVVLSPGADPMEVIRQFAQENRFLTKLDAISLGKGQGKIAAEAVANAKERGRWVLLQNSHLAGSWMRELEAIVRFLSSSD
jgi:dynein heavy chain